MKFTFFHNNINVLDLDKSVEFYKKALGLEVTKGGYPHSPAPR